MRRQLISIVIALVVIAGLSFGGYLLVTGGDQVVFTHAASTTEALDAKLAATAGQDYSLNQTKSFDDYTVAEYDPSTDGGESGVVVWKRSSDGYTVLLGPATNVAAYQTSGYPADVTSYIKKLGYSNAAATANPDAN